MQYQDDAVSIGEWILTFIILILPLINLIALLYWSFSSGTNPSKANFAKAYLIIILVMFVLGMALAFLAPTLLPHPREY